MSLQVSRSASQLAMEISDACALSCSYYGSLDWFHTIQNGPQTLQGIRQTAIVKHIGEEMKLKHEKSPSMQRVKSTNCKVTSN